MARKPSPLSKAKQIVGAQYAPIDHALGVAQQQSAAQQQALNAARLALVQQLQQGVAPAGHVYDSAVQQQQALAQSGAKLLSDANPNQGIQQGLQSLGSPTEQQGQIASSLQSLFPGAGSVLNVQQGTVPGATLLAQKAATQGYLAGLPTVAALSGEQSLRGLLASAADTRNKLLEQRLQVGGQLPALAQSLAQQGVENAQANRQFGFQQQQLASQQRQDALDRQFRAQQAELDRRAAIVTSPYQQAQLDLSQRQLDADIAASKLKAVSAPKIFGSGGSGYYTLDANGNPVQLVRPSKTTGPGGLSLTQTRSARAKANQLLAHVREARAAFQAKTAYTSGAKKGQLMRETAPTYDEAVKAAEQQGIPLEIAVPMLNTVFPVQYEVTDRGLVQTGIRGYPSTFTKQPGGKRKRKRK